MEIFLFQKKKTFLAYINQLILQGLYPRTDTWCIDVDISIPMICNYHFE